MRVFGEHSVALPSVNIAFRSRYEPASYWEHYEHVVFAQIAGALVSGDDPVPQEDEL